MQQGPRLKASQGAQAMTMPTKPQRAKGTQNSPKADQNKAKGTLRWPPKCLHMMAYTMAQTWNMKHKLFKTLKKHQL